MRLIDADEVIKHLEKCIADPMFDNDYRKICFAICNYIDGVSTIEAEPVKRGKWIDVDYKTLEHGFIETHYGKGLCCSLCRCGFKKDELKYRNFCPSCGARMRGDDK